MMSLYCTLLSLSVHREAAGDADHLAGHEVGVVARKKRDKAGDVVGLAKALQRDRPLQPVIDLLAVLAFADEGTQQGGIRRSRTDDVDPDVVARTFPRHRLRERDDAALAGRIDGLA